MARTRSLGISGLALGMAAAGGFFVYLGLNNVPVLDGLRELATGKLPTPRPRPPLQVNFDTTISDAVADALGAVNAATSGIGAQIAADARKYLGVPYKWGGADPSGMDCSGLVTYVLHHDLGIELPNNVHTVTGEFYVWTGAKTVPRSECRAGDLVCWPTHIGIATSDKTMIAAPTFGERVKEENIWWVPEPLIRRVIAAAPNPAAVHTPGQVSAQ